MDHKNKIIIDKELPFPIDLVWTVLTDDAHLKKWYFDFAGTWKLEIQNTFEWSGGPADGMIWLHRGVILEIIPEKRLKHSWAYPGYSGTSVVTWELKPISKNDCHFSLTHEFIIPFDEKENALKQENFSIGWNAIIGNELPKYLSGLRNDM